MNGTTQQLKSRIEATNKLRRGLPSPAMRRVLRQTAGCSLGDVAQAVGVTRQAVGLWETGRRNPRAGNLERYVDVLAMLRQAVNGP